MKLPLLSGKEVVKILQKRGFKILDQKGSHVIMRKINGKKLTAVVPQHPEIAKGTLLSILKQAEMTRDDLEEALS
ncbi:type II toxin-antitoxin system HicA family toxin [Candidatus Woesearchaeota archaeon]|nr:MAG: type II toxin-antitoxin system HicA family toxin [Candidatus Woesearchaeota archaeon]